MQEINQDSSIVQDTVGTILQYRFMFARPNNKVMTAALTRSYERTVQTVLSRSQNCCSVNEADFSCGGRLFQHVGPDTAKLGGP